MTPHGGVVAPRAVRRWLLTIVAPLGAACAPSAAPAPAPAPVVAVARPALACDLVAQVGDSLLLDQFVSAGFVSRVPLREVTTSCRAGTKCTPDATSTPNQFVLRADSYATDGCLVGVRRDGASFAAKVDTAATAMLTSALLVDDSFTGSWRSADRVLTVGRVTGGYRVRGTARQGRTTLRTDDRGTGDGLTLRVAPTAGARSGCLLLVRAYPGTDLLAAWDNGRCGGPAASGWRGVYRREAATR